MNLQELEKRLEMAYENLILNSEQYREQAEKVRQLDKNLKLDVLQAYANNEISGKNQTERDAAEYERFKGQFNQLENEKHFEAVRFQKKEALEIEVRYLHDIIRVKELAQVTKE